MTSTCFVKSFFVPTVSVPKEIVILIFMIVYFKIFSHISVWYNRSIERCTLILVEHVLFLVSFIQMPTNEADWKQVEKTFEKWNFPHCLGAMDRKHIQLQAPTNSGLEYFNYKSFPSIVLFALVDGDYNFIYASAGCQGRISDSGVVSATYFKKCLDAGTLHLPEPCPLPGRIKKSPFVFVGDEAFALSKNVMKPYAGDTNKGSRERIFNYRLSRARRISENVFGIISAVFRILRKPILLEPKVARQVVLAIIHLHNYLRKTSKSRRIYNLCGTYDTECSDTGDIIQEGIWRKLNSTSIGMINLRKVPRRSKTDDELIRDEFAEYFVSPEGAVKFQWNK